MVKAFTIARPGGEKWEIRPAATRHESDRRQWYELIREKKKPLRALAPTSARRKDLIKIFEGLDYV